MVAMGGEPRSALPVNKPEKTGARSELAPRAAKTDKCSYNCLSLVYVRL